MPQRLYLKARFILGEMLIRFWRQQGIEDALRFYLYILQLDRGDHQGCRNLIPAMYLRLGRDQDCYDFLKWRATSGSQPGFEDPAKPYLDTKDADATEPVDPWMGFQMFNLSHLGTLMLLKMRLLQALKHGDDGRLENPALSASEILAKIRPEYVGDILERRPDLIADPARLEATGERVSESIDQLHKAIDKVNEHYIMMILYPGPEEFGAGPTPYMAGSEEEARLTFMYTVNAWMESPREVMGDLEDRLRELELDVPEGGEAAAAA